MQNKIRKIGIFGFAVMFLACLISTLLCINVFAEEKSAEINITVKNEYSIENLPVGVEGCTYPIFDFVATDSLGNEIKDTEVNVFYDVNGDTKNGGTQDDVLVVINGNRFNTQNAGQYVIEYSAKKDTEVKIERIFINVIEDDKYVQPQYVINESIVEQSFTGQKVYLPDGQLIANNRFGNTSVEIEVVYQGQHDCGDVEVVCFDSALKYFTPVVNGEYQVVYKITNILGTEEMVKVSKPITVVDDIKPTIIEPSLSAVYFKDEQIKFPYVEAVQYYNGQIIYVPVEVAFNGEKIGRDMLYTPTESGVFNLTFTALNVINGLSDAQITYEVEVKDKGADEQLPYINKFIKFDGFEGSYKLAEEGGVFSDCYVLVADGSENSAQMSFKTKIAVQFLQFSMGIVPEKCNFSEFELLLTDSKNSSEKIVATFKKGGDGLASVYVNGFKAADLKNVNFKAAECEFAVNYDYENKSIIFADGDKEHVVNINSYLDGSEFKGFSSGKVYVKVLMNDIQGESWLNLETFAAEYVSDSTADRTKPKFVFETSITDVIAYTTDINQTINIKNYLTFDLFDENPKTYLQIIAPDGTLVVDSVEMLTDYEFKVEQYGIYELIFKFVDSSNQARTFMGIIQVIDRVAPTVKELPDFDTTVKLGETYNFPSVKFEDNVSEELTEWVFVSYGNFQKALAKNDKYTFSEKGVYTIKHCATDGMGNRTVVVYTITCE